MNTITDDCIIHYMYCNVRTTGTLVHVMKKDNYVIHDSRVIQYNTVVIIILYCTINECNEVRIPRTLQT